MLRPGLALVGRKGPVRPQRNRKRKWSVGDSRRVWEGSNMKGKAMGGIHCSLSRVWVSRQMPRQVRGRCWAGSWALACFQREAAGSALIFDLFPLKNFE